MKLKYLCIIIILFGTHLPGLSQNNLRSKLISVSRDTIVLDSLLILPSTVSLSKNGALIDTSLYRIDSSNGLLITSPQLRSEIDSIQIQYRVFNYNINKAYFKRSIAEIHPIGNLYKRTGYGGINNYSRGVLQSSQLEKQGNYSRGISYGNNQDVVTNSSLNLQLSGKLSDDVNILAAISDNNIPIQPDGNTQTIQDFDRIYIKLFDETKELTLGDYEVESPGGVFMRYFKKVQGGRFSGLISKREAKNKFSSTISASIAKGKFNRLEFQGAEGIQGPYRLTGSNNESYIVILAGSEKVYIDGKKLLRGEQNDYTINYNTAEVYFTTQQPITQNSRIIVEFEYSEENYSRYLIVNSNEFKTQSGKFWLNYYHEQDNKNQSIDQNISNSEKLILSEIGDNLDLAFVNNEEVVEYTNDFILYRKSTRIINNREFEIFEYSTNPEETNYRVNFTFVGLNNGNYIETDNLVNGRVYEWVDPVNGVPQGSYAPIIRLIPPQKQQMLTFGGDISLNEALNSKFELAFSNYDINTFSSKDDSDNKGIATDFSLDKKFKLNDTLKHLHSSVRFHFIHKNFEQIENFRSVEFERDWNIGDDLESKNESLVQFKNKFVNQHWGNTSYELALLKRESDYSGLKHNLLLRYHQKRTFIDFNGSALNTNQDLHESKFYRHRLNANYSLNFVKIGVETENENNRMKEKETNQLLSNSFSFYSYKFYIQNVDSTNNLFHAYYKKRRDYQAFEDDFERLSQSDDIGATIWFRKNRNHQLKIETVYRKLSPNKSISDINPENTFLGKLEHSVKIKKGLIQTSTYYELGSGLESEKEFSYVEVNDGQGVYRWTDYNNNDIKELNEFEIANFKDEANYIRIATNTNQYQKVYTSDYRQSLHLWLKRLKRKTGMAGFISRFSNRFAYRLSKKSLKDDFHLYANPFRYKSSNPNIITVSNSFQNTLSYRKPKSKTSWDLLHLSSNSKQLLTQGFERRKLNQNGIRIGWRIAKSSQITNRFDFGRRNLNQENFENQNYKLKEFKNELKLKFQPSLVFQFGINYTYNDKENSLHIEHSKNHNIGADCQYSVTKNGKLTAGFNLLSIDYNSDSNTSIAYEMLEGFLPGKNYTWNLGYNQQISKVLQMNITYNGRNSEEGKTIHVGSMNLRAYF